MSQRLDLSHTVLHWYTTETYLYGVIQKAGGKMNAVIHLETDEYGTVVVDIPREVLDKTEANLLYKEVGIHVELEQNVNGVIKGQRAKFLAFLDYVPNLAEFIQAIESGQYAPYYKDISDSVKWVKALRGTA